MPVVATPCTKYFCREKKRRKQGISDNVDMANMDPQDEAPALSRKSLRPIGTVKVSGELS